DEPFENKATITFGVTTSENQPTESAVEDKFAYSKSDASASSTKGKAKFKKIGWNPVNGEVVNLEGVQFKLMKKVGNKDYLIAEATSDQNGEFLFENI